MLAAVDRALNTVLALLRNLRNKPIISRDEEIEDDCTERAKAQS